MPLLLPALLFKLWRRGAAEPLYRQHWSQRLGFYRGMPRASLEEASEADSVQPRVWLHAVSLGETRAAAPLVQALREAIPGMRLLLTHGTATGREAGLALLREGDMQAWLPFDTPGATRRFLCHFQPRVGVLMETEVWPQLLSQARVAGVPMLLANARLSERSLRRGQRLACLLRPAAQSIKLAMSQTGEDAQRLQQAGMPLAEVFGNLKFDMQPSSAQMAQGLAWREALGRPVVLAASTREGEELALLEAWQQAWSPAEPRPLLLLVPRHPQRFAEVQGLVAAQGLRGLRRSTDWDNPALREPGVDVLLGDSMGEMALYYSAADLALLGGSFEPFGGQNLIEAAACGCPVIAGPHTFNFGQACALSLQAGAAWQVADVRAALTLAQALLSDQPSDGPAATSLDGPTDPAATQTSLLQAKQQARSFAEAHRGAAKKMAAEVAAILRG
jgi:3-deoxy-D-manno-octulosonic-acid transferase